MVRFSIVVPVYNVERFVCDCLDSIVKQCEKTDEVICVDDGSSDSSPKILDDYATRYTFLKVIHQENQGLAKARNRGLREATGDYVWFVDADDAICDGALTAIRGELDEEIDIFSFSHNSLSETGDLVKTCIGKYKTTHCRAGVELYLKNNVLSYAWNKVYRKNFLAENNLKFELYIPEDEEFLFRAYIFAGRCKTSNAAFYNYRIVEGSITHTLSSYMKIANGIIEMTERHSLYIGKYKNCPYWQKVLFSNVRNVFLDLYRAENRKQIGKAARIERLQTFSSSLKNNLPLISDGSVKYMLLALISHYPRLSFALFSLLAFMKKA